VPQRVIDVGNVVGNVAQPPALADYEFRVLGPVAVRAGARWLDLGTPRQQALLAILLVNVGQVVSRDSIVTHLWGDHAPAAATSTLHAYVSRLRKVLDNVVTDDPDGSPLRYQAPGYLLAVDPARIDAYAFEAATGKGHRLLAAGRYTAALRYLSQALRTWEGTPYAGLAGYDFAVGEAERLHQLRLAAVGDRAHAYCALGQYRRAVDELEREVYRCPLYEPLVRQLMLAQYGLGRQAEALRVYERTRTRLAADLGIDASPELQDLHRAILRQEVAVPGGAQVTDEVPVPLVRRRPVPRRRFAVRRLNRR
jgi:DNA-binding SARP family transcriptional activator